jgi:hypothetical protein
MALRFYVHESQRKKTRRRRMDRRMAETAMSRSVLENIAYLQSWAAYLDVQFDLDPEYAADVEQQQRAVSTRVHELHRALL